MEIKGLLEVVFELLPRISKIDNPAFILKCLKLIVLFFFWDNQYTKSHDKKWVVSLTIDHFWNYYFHKKYQSQSETINLKEYMKNVKIRLNIIIP